MGCKPTGMEDGEKGRTEGTKGNVQCQQLLEALLLCSRIFTCRSKLKKIKSHFDCLHTLKEMHFVIVWFLSNPVRHEPATMYAVGLVLPTIRPCCSPLLTRASPCWCNVYTKPDQQGITPRYI
ncbi:uncharacterized protein LOC111259082 [Varroa jacobsoni]|uniref:uncharacterized protein LOC111259082 n=1 Tax=Varroa jacobsoni TaxID=62625 RepID=UPI000BF7380C|nr:uncharacterized protein LOC111259082 [Varroa jacobsoni]